jgi:hypothetical protein
VTRRLQPGGDGVLDLTSRVATLVKSDDQTGGQVAQLMGKEQTTPGVDSFVGWARYLYLRDQPGRDLLFNSELPDGLSTYCAHLLAGDQPGWSSPLAAKR